MPPLRQWRNTKARLDAEKNQKGSNEIQVDEILTWAGQCEEVSYEAKQNRGEFGAVGYDIRHSGY